MLVAENVLRADGRSAIVCTIFKCRVVASYLRGKLVGTCFCSKCLLVLSGVTVRDCERHPRREYMCNKLWSEARGNFMRRVDFMRRQMARSQRTSCAFKKRQRLAHHHPPCWNCGTVAASRLLFVPEFQVDGLSQIRSRFCHRQIEFFPRHPRRQNRRWGVDMGTI